MTTHKFVIFIAGLAALIAFVNGNTCTNFNVGEEPPFTLGTWSFGMQDSDNGKSASYDFNLYNNYYPSPSPFGTLPTSLYNNLFNYFINAITLSGGKNYSTSDTGETFVQTSNFTCTSDHSGVWGPAYPDFRFTDENMRGRFQNIEAYVHYSAPSQTSYVRSILSVKNIGNQVERVLITGDWYLWSFAADVSDPSNENRYITMFPWQNGDLGQNGDNPGLTFERYPTTLHRGGPKARYSDVVINHNMGWQIVSPVDYAELEPGQEMAVMFIVSLGKNVSRALSNAAAIDAEPAYIFHDLNADQLSLIRNWGGCEVILGPEVAVTVNPPAQCSIGLTSDFTVSAVTQRNDFTAGFTHRVVLANGDLLVQAQSESTITVPNSAGAVVHQLWYKECLVKETPFMACERATPSAPVTNTPTSVPTATPTSKTSTASSSSLINVAVIAVTSILTTMFGSRTVTRSSLMMICAALLVLNQVTAQSTCNSNPIGTYNNPAALSFGANDGNGLPLYSAEIAVSWATSFDYWVSPLSSSFNSEHTFYINGIPLNGGINDTWYDRSANFVPTANFTCTSESSAIWGPAYPDFFDSDQNKRGQYHNLEVYVHYSAPFETSYIRSIVFIKNIGNTVERVRLFGDWRTNDFAIDRSPLNGGRYYTLFPWQQGDMGQFGDNPAELYEPVIESVHVAGPNGREIKQSRVVPQYNNDFDTSPVYNTLLDAGKEMAVMYITSYGVNLTLALKNAAEIDTEPAFIFHDLNADQLSLIRNWGACQSVLGPDLSVQVEPPAQCSNGATSDFVFTVVQNSDRDDFTVGFTHRVVSSLTGAQIVAPQPTTTTTLSVLNNVGLLKHQLWYRECLVVETLFDSCGSQA